MVESAGLLAEDRAPVGKASPNALSTYDSPTIQITHPTHPLYGQQFAVVPLYGGKMDPRQVLILLPNGEQRLIPAEWTNQVAQADYPAGVCFLPERLLALRQRLDLMLVRTNDQAILKMADTQPLPPGGSHATVDSNTMGTIDAGTACPDYRHPGSDAATSGESTSGGRQ
jgi:hypothetical protein